MSINSTSTEKQKFQSRYSTLIHLENRGLTISNFKKKCLLSLNVVCRGSGSILYADDLQSQASTLAGLQRIAALVSVYALEFNLSIALRSSASLF